MPKLNRDGVEIYYEVHGEGPPVLLSHGYSATSHMWAGQVAPFSERYKLITWDMRGHGKSDYPEDQGAYSTDETVADMAAILDAVGAKAAVIGGLSLGGYMSLAFYRAHPERAQALLIIDTGPGYRNDEARAGWNATAIRRAERLETEGLPQPGTGGAETRGSPHRNATGLAKAARGMLAQFDARVIDSLPSIAVPTLVLAGANDGPFLGATDYMAAKIPGAKKVIIPDAGHASNIDQPAAFNQAVLGFLDELSLETA